MRRILVALLALGACFKVPDFESGALRCDRGHCPPGMDCRPDGFCYRPADVIIDAPPCPQGEHRCVNGNVEVCQSNQWVPGQPSCADLGQQCFDPGASGGTDAYCGTCLKGAQRCAGQAPPTRQTCPEETGIWTDAEPCDATFGCFDLDGPDAPAAYCGVCLTGDKRCNSGLQTCNAGQWEGPADCTVMGPGWSCIDPLPAGGVDAYCGLCLKGEIVCHGDNRDQCTADGTAFVTLEPCTWGCDASATCCAQPDCEGRVCGGSLTNACGRTRICGPCNGSCCDDGFRCCGTSSFCCGSICCSIGSCCDGDFCMPGGCP